MTQRHTADTITDDELDALYTRAEQAEAVIDRARAFAHELRHEDAMGLLAALDEQASPSAAEAATRLVAAAQRAARATQQDFALTGSEATEATQMETTARVFAGLHRSAAQNVSRVIALYEQWVKAGPPPLGTLISRWWDARLLELHDAIQPPNETTET